MPEIVRELTVNAPIEATWALVSDMERFSLCIPGCKEVKKVSETEFDWVMEAKVLRTTRRVTARTRTELMRAPSHAEFVGEGRLFERSNHYKLTIRGNTDLESVSPSSTRICFSGDVKASGVGGAIIDKVASGQMEELFAEFEKNVKRALGDEGDTAALHATPVPAVKSTGGPRWGLYLAAAGLIAMLGLAAYALY
ncbi:MAG: SRPBCC family protein [Gammaproteobacteria bacterium]|nr:SRPBCC family protein [Gammaproteobacteria bacterium]